MVKGGFNRIPLQKELFWIYHHLRDLRDSIPISKSSNFFVGMLVKNVVWMWTHSGIVLCLAVSKIIFSAILREKGAIILQKRKRCISYLIGDQSDERVFPTRLVQRPLAW